MNKKIISIPDKKKEKKLKVEKKSGRVVEFHQFNKAEEEKEWLLSIASNPGFTFLSNDNDDLFSFPE